jgi:Flp pilus assembly pilin Flp
MSRLIHRFICNEAGTTAVEYGLIVAGISVSIIIVAIRLAIK